MNNKKGFTLIEVLAVVVILGLLSSVAVIAVSRYRKQADEKEKIELKNTIKAAFNNYRLRGNTSIEKNKKYTNEAISLSFDNGLKYAGKTCKNAKYTVGYIVNGDYMKIDNEDENIEIASKAETICVQLYCNDNDQAIIDDFKTNSLCETAFPEE